METSALAKAFMQDANEEIIQINKFLEENKLDKTARYRCPYTGEEIEGTPLKYTFQDRILQLLAMQVQAGKVYIYKTQGITFNKQAECAGQMMK